MCLTKVISRTLLKSALGARCFVSVVRLRPDVSSARITLTYTITLVSFCALPKHLQTTLLIPVKAVLTIASVVTRMEIV